MPINTEPSRQEPRPTRIARGRAALVVFRLNAGKPHFLLIPSARNPAKLTLPGGKIGRDETALQAAVRETLEEAGVFTDPPRALGCYTHKKRRYRLHPTDTFLARYAGALAQPEYEGRPRTWVTLDELAAGTLGVRKPIRKQLERAAHALREQRLAA